LTSTDLSKPFLQKQLKQEFDSKLQQLQNAGLQFVATSLFKYLVCIVEISISLCFEHFNLV